MPGPTLTFRDRVKALCPGWLREGVAERLMYGFGLAIDGVVDKLTQGILGRFPTRCDTSFLPVIAGDRVVILGPTEPVASQRRRLQKAFEGWQIAGSSRSLLSEALPILLPYQPQIREVSTRFEPDPGRIPVQVAQGVGFTITSATNETPIVITTSVPHGFTTGQTVRVGNCKGNTAANNSGGTAWTVTVISEISFSLDTSVGNGTYTIVGGAGNVMGFPAAYPPERLSSLWYTYAAGADPDAAPTRVFGVTGDVGDWEWDTFTQEASSWMWQECFVILYAVSPQDFAAPPEWAWGDVDVTWDTLPGSWGLSVDFDYIENIRVALRLRKAGNTNIRYIIVSFDATLFDPTMPAGGGINPEGEFGDWHIFDGAAWKASRLSEAVYCEGVI